MRDQQAATHEYEQLATQLAAEEAAADEANQVVDDLEDAASLVFVAMGRSDIVRVEFGVRPRG